MRNFPPSRSITARRSTCCVRPCSSSPPTKSAAARRGESIMPTSSRDLWRKMGRPGGSSHHGWTTSTAARRWANLAHCVANGEVSRASAAVGPVLRRALEPVRQPDPAQRLRSAKAQVSPELISGEHVGALAMSEPGSGSDWSRCACAPTAGAIATRINGSKMWITKRPGCRHAGRLCQDGSAGGVRRASPHS